jgi:hypothetical protein
MAWTICVRQANRCADYRGNCPEGSWSLRESFPGNWSDSARQLPGDCPANARLLLGSCSANARMIHRMLGGCFAGRCADIARLTALH